MANLFNKDFQDFLITFNESEVEYILVGGYAVIVYGHVRTTGDMDIWVHKTLLNYQKITAAFKKFGMPIFDMTEQNFLKNPEMDVFSFGVPPVSIDLMTEIKGLKFIDAIQHAEWHTFDMLKVRVISLEDLLKAKAASQRPKDLDDIDHLSSYNS